jgi:DNA-binding IclR family transcriptional regulator
VEDRILNLLHQQAARRVDQGLTVAELAKELDADQNDVLAALRRLEASGLAYNESFWWYPGRRADLAAEIDQS